MPTTKAVNSKASIGTALNYIENSEKTSGGKLIDTIGCDIRSAQEEFEQVRNYYNKTDGRTYKHYIIAFDPNAEIQPTPELAMKICKEIIQNTPHLQGFQCVIAVHTDKAHIHAHIIINSVNVIDGHKLNESKAQLHRMKEIQNGICQFYGFKPPEKNNRKVKHVDYNKNRFQANLKHVNKKELVAHELYMQLNELYGRLPEGLHFYKFVEEQTKGSDIQFRYNPKHKYQAFRYKDQIFREKFLIEHYGKYSKQQLQRSIEDDRDRNEIDRIIAETERGLADIEKRKQQPENPTITNTIGESATDDTKTSLDWTLDQLSREASERSERDKRKAERLRIEEQQRIAREKERIREREFELARAREKTLTRSR